MSDKKENKVYVISDLNLDHIALVTGMPAVEEAFVRMTKSHNKWIPENYEIVEKSCMDYLCSNGVNTHSKISKSSTEHKIAWFTILVPNKVDRQGDIIYTEEIEKTRIRFMENYKAGILKGIGGLSKDHVEFTKNYGTIIDSFVDYNGSFFADSRSENNHSIANAWVLGIKLSDEIWAMYKQGAIQGVSIGGVGKRVPLNEIAEERESLSDNIYKLRDNFINRIFE